MGDKQEEEEKEIIRLYLKKKISAYKIAKKFKCSVHPIYDILKKNKIKLFPNGFFIRGKTPWNKCLTKEIDERIKRYGEKGSKSKKGCSVWNKGLKGTHFSRKTEFKKGHIPHCKGKNKNNYKPLEMASKKHKELWKNPEYAKKILSSLIKRPTSYEKKISELCIENNLPFIYTGNGTFLIGHKNPDFIGKKRKLAIEVYHDYFKIRDFGSCENYEKQRSEYFAKYGWDVIFIRTEEIEDKNWESICLNKIKTHSKQNGK